MERTLVLCTLYGGNDGLNTVIPYESSAYQALRREIAIPHDQALPLGKAGDVALGFHPALVGLKSLWEAGQVAVVLGVGYPNPNFSHFQSMEIMQSADPTGEMPAAGSGVGWTRRLRSDPCPVGRHERPGRVQRDPPKSFDAGGLHNSGRPDAGRRPEFSGLTPSSNMFTPTSPPLRPTSPRRAATCSPSAQKRLRRSSRKSPPPR